MERKATQREGHLDANDFICKRNRGNSWDLKAEACVASDFGNSSASEPRARMANLWHKCQSDVPERFGRYASIDQHWQTHPILKDMPSFHMILGGGAGCMKMGYVLMWPPEAFPKFLTRWDPKVHHHWPRRGFSFSVCFHLDWLRFLWKCNPACPLKSKCNWDRDFRQKSVLVPLMSHGGCNG